MFKSNNCIVPNKVHVWWHFSSNKINTHIGTLIQHSRVRHECGNLATFTHIYIYIINNAASKAQGYCFAKSPLIKITLGLAVVVGMNK